MAHARQNQGRLSNRSSGIGGITHLATALLVSMGGVTLVHVPYKSSAFALTDLIGGQIQVVVGSMLPTLPPWICA